MSDARAELVRINDKGEAHPIGVVASRRLRARVGAYRVLPAPKHVVFMRYTGEDGRRDDEDGAIVRLAGEITAPAGLCDVMAMLAHTRWRGELAVLSTDAERAIFMENGNVVGAETTAADERLGSVMYRYGAMDDAQYQKVMQRVEAGARFGDAAIELGVSSREQVYAYLGKQIEEIVYAAMAVDDGTFYFLEGFDHERLVSHHTLSANMLLMDGVTRLDEIRYFRQKIPDADWVVFGRDRTSAPAAEFVAVLAAVDGKLTIAELGRTTGLGEFETTKAVYALIQSGHVSVRPPRVSGGPKALVGIANSALSAIHRHVDAGGQGNGFRGSLASFVAGGGIYDMLFRGAGPQEDGTLDADVVVENVAALHGGDPDEYLKDKLHEYMSFALFCAGGLLGSGGEVALTRELESLFGSLQPRK
jgi:hypothetical protein